MSQTENLQVKLVQRPVGLPGDEVWEFAKGAVPEPDEGQVVVRVRYISVDPAMRGWMNEGKSYVPPVGIGEVMRALAVGEVVASRHQSLKVGDAVSGLIGVQRYALIDGDQLTPIDVSAVPMTRFLSVLGMTGMTAYFGLLDVGQPQAGETVLVSGAAGAVGSVVGQIAKLKGCHVVGICGGPEKAASLLDMGFDAAIDYRNEDLGEALKTHCPKGVDVYFDNVGGDTLDTVLTRIRKGARIVICGAISQYNATEGVKGPANYLSLLVNRARMEGFVIFDYASRYGEAVGDMASWLAEGKLSSKEHVVSGLESFPEALRMLFDGRNQGKLVLEVDADD